jgi:hypothetical protein
VPQVISYKTVNSFDLDKFIFNTGLYIDIYISVVKKFDIEIGRLTERAKTEADEKGVESFDARSFVDRLVSSADLKIIDRMRTDAVREVDLLNEGGWDLIDYATNDALSVITTYGDPEVQRRKMADAGIIDKVAYLVTGRTEKGRLFRKWKDPSGGYRIPIDEIIIPPKQRFHIDTEIHVDTIVHGDDKANSFKGAPDKDFVGYLYRNPKYEVLPSQEGDVPSSVIVVASLRQIIELERERKSAQ